MRSLAASMFVVALATVGCAEQSRSSVNLLLQVRNDSSFSANANGESGYSQIGAVEYSTLGGIIAFVDGERVVRLDSTGALVKTANRVGSGPGEWRFVGWAGPDSTGVAVLDKSTLRLVRLTLDLSTAGDVRVPGIALQGPVVGRTSDGSFITALEPNLVPGFGEQVYSTTLVRWFAGRDQVDTILVLPGTDTFVDQAEQMYVKIPAGRVDWAAVRDSVLVGGNGGGDSVFVQRGYSQGKWVRLRLPPAKRVDAARIAAFVEAEVGQVVFARDRARMRRTFAKVKIPDLAPRFERLALDERDWIWTIIGSDGLNNIWQAFTFEGDSVDQLLLPIEARPRLMRRNEIIATVTDADGLQRIVRYLLQ